MAGEVTLDRDKLERSLNKLLELHENVTILHEGLRRMQARQDSDTWSALGGSFSRPYSAALHEAVSNINSLREQLCAYRDTLTASADRLALIDAEVQDRLARLAARADGIVTPMPAQNAPWQAPAGPTTGYEYNPATNTGYDPNTGVTQHAPVHAVLTAHLPVPESGTPTVPPSQGSGIG
ncbi:hypothetical protein [Cellulomonas sp. URHD0024]|uniref:hypothetical protein n=1 Tax=Cellulomonas sp. URHD0024 TaxID=1302620 RepID=UPI000482FC70|nr:hypothetical protein [Cellulomonas sp. URHD0024]